MTDGAPTLDARCRAIVAELRLGNDEDIRAVSPLSGGVASDIARVELKDAVVCIKFALPKLKVAEDWQAPVHRNRAEYAWLRVASCIAPDVAPRLFGRSEHLHGFAMEFLDGRDVYLWKEALLAGETPRGEARQVADFLGRIHGHSAGAGFDRGAFHNRDDFDALRIDPYLRFTATRHPDIADRMTAVAEQLYAADTVLVHGDVSPKNIVFRGGRPVLLDAECATMGDASFDVAFCMNHLILKAAHLPGMRKALLRETAEFWRAYRARIAWENADALGHRVAVLLPMLMLARVDGKSPVEYLDAGTASQVRATALTLIQEPQGAVEDFIARIATEFEERAR
jgi:aminoglycoside phosphotransferase (APT) family kinase protein